MSAPRCAGCAELLPALASCRALTGPERETVMLWLKAGAESSLAESALSLLRAAAEPEAKSARPFVSTWCEHGAHVDRPCAECGR